MIDRLSEPGLVGKVNQGDHSMESSMDGMQPQEPPKIGKLRVYKSGKIVMRMQLPGQENYVDLELNQGI